jgi:hypothetical protein
MLPDLKDIETRAGRFTIGATARSTKYRNVQGTVAAIRWTGYFYSIEIAGTPGSGPHSDNAANYELLSPLTWPSFNYVNPNAQQATAGEFEVLLPGERDRIYFADTAEQAIALVAATVGLDDQEHEVAYLNKLVEAGPVDERRWRGNAALEGQPAYISTRQQRPASRFNVGDSVTFYGHTPRTINGIALYKSRDNYGLTEWHYYAEALGNHYPMSESITQPATPSAMQAAA